MIGRSRFAINDPLVSIQSLMTRWSVTHQPESQRIAYRLAAHRLSACSAAATQPSGGRG